MGADGLERALTFALARIGHNAGRLQAFPHTTRHGRWLESEHGRWTAGFWVGLLWVAHLATGEQSWRERAAAWARRLEPRCDDTSTHDLGFLFEPSFILGWSITGEAYYRQVALRAAAALATRFRPEGRYICAWDDDLDGRTIVDTVMNLSLLFWSGRMDIATAVAETTAREHVRADGSTFHVVDFDPATGRVVRRGTHQGWADGSCWSRGQAWALYGFCRAYQWTGDERFLSTSCRLADYFVRRLPPDRLPPWDFDAPPGGPRDAAAGAIAASGLLELDRVRGGYRAAAIELLEALAVHAGDAETEGILPHAAADVPRGSAVDESLIYGDYYFVEALCKACRPELWERLSCTTPAS